MLVEVQGRGELVLANPGQLEQHPLQQVAPVVLAVKVYIHLHRRLAVLKHSGKSLEGDYEKLEVGPLILQDPEQTLLEEVLDGGHALYHPRLAEDSGKIVDGLERGLFLIVQCRFQDARNVPPNHVSELALNQHE